MSEHTFQADLFSEPVYTREMTIQERFIAFDRANPWVKQAIIRLAREAKGRGHSHYGIKSIIEILRWEWHRKTNDPHAEWKINNSYSSRYARAVEEAAPDLRGFFKMRELLAA